MTRRGVIIFVAAALFAAVDGEPEQCLLQSKAARGKSLELSATQITEEELISTEKLFTSGEADHGDIGGDRMSSHRHNYAPIYAKHLTSFLEAGDVPTVAEVGILKGTGIAMWSSLFPKSQVLGFDLNTSSYENNVKHMRSLGFRDGSVKVTAMNQMEDNWDLLQSALGDLRPNIVIDDGYHIPEAGEKTFLNMKPFLANRFVYFIEDLIKKEIDDGLWEPVKAKVLKECPGCKFLIECPPTSQKNECMVVIHRSAADDVALQVETAVMTQTSKLEPPDYDSFVVHPMPWESGEEPLVKCPSKSPTNPDAAEDNLQKAMKIFCDAGLGSFIEFYVDPRFKANYERLKGPDGWIEKAFVTYMGMKEAKQPFSAQEDLLVQSVHHFSKFPVVLTNFDHRLSPHMTPERFPNLVLMHAREGTRQIHKDFNFNKIHSMLFTKVKGGVVLDADQWITSGVNRMMVRAFEETTKEYPYAILPAHWMSRDPESSDMVRYPEGYTFTFKGKATPPKRSMHWGHAHPTWTHYALPWLAKWSSYVLAPNKTDCPDWLKQEPFMADEDLLNVASWADGLTKQWCKFDLPGNQAFDTYLEQRTPVDRSYKDSKFYPKGAPLMFLTSHDGKDPQKSYTWLAKLWEGSEGMPEGSLKTISYNGTWFASGKELKKYDPDLKCIA